MTLAGLRRDAGVLGQNKLAFLRWAWLRVIGKTAYRFAPLYSTTVDIEGGIRQANGLYLPPGSRHPVEDVDWDVAFREQFAKHDAAKKKARKKRTA